MFKTLDDIEINGDRVIVRGDLNVPMKDGKVTDATRIERLAPTLRELSDRGARVVIMAHFGRPKGKTVEAMSLRAVVAPLADVLEGRPVSFVGDCVGTAAKRAVAALEPGALLLLENLRFHPEEEANDGAFAAELASLGDFYVNDAFSAAHRAHASTEAITHLLPAIAGRSMQTECAALSKALEAPARPVMAIVGGAKVSTKLEILANLTRRVDQLVIGGAMANTFLLAQGCRVGTSLVEPALVDEARSILERAEKDGSTLILPIDATVSTALESGAETRDVGVDEVPDDCMILDIGPRTTSQLMAQLASCSTLLWNGPLGVFETPPFDRGTVEVARHAAALTEAGALMSLAGGGDTIAALRHSGVMEQFSYVSTAGGAFLEWLEGRSLPGLVALEAN